MPNPTLDACRHHEVGFRPDKPPPTETERVYFISDGEHIKIGIAADPTGRLRDLQVGNARRLTLLRVVNGPRGLEDRLHRRFAGDRVRGEWFKRSDRLVRFVLCRSDAAVGRVVSGRQERDFDPVLWARYIGPLVDYGAAR